MQAGQSDEDDQPNQQPPLLATPSQINVDLFHQLSRELSFIHSFKVKSQLMWCTIET
jgi:hypothetical protein